MHLIAKQLGVLRCAVPMAGGGLGEGGQVGDAVADRRLARALVHHVPSSLQGSRVHEGGDGGAPLRLRRRRRLHRPCKSSPSLLVCLKKTDGLN